MTDYNSRAPSAAKYLFDGDTEGDNLHAYSGWAEVGTASGADATATRAAEAGKSHYIAHISASLDASGIVTLTVKDGTTTVLQAEVHNAEVIPLPRPLKITEGNKVDATLVSGGLTATGHVTIMGYTI